MESWSVSREQIHTTIILQRNIWNICAHEFSTVIQVWMDPQPLFEGCQWPLEKHYNSPSDNTIVTYVFKKAY